ncbi:hypothetical protein LTR53_014716 [Teratosphaeriaceae sp. CCFEE 6253]|nr:hypothetical protein LTR53_014716 [Teratosphaeriaceae sp. CCFEE 6253]
MPPVPTGAAGGMSGPSTLDKAKMGGMMGGSTSTRLRTGGAHFDEAQLSASSSASSLAPQTS